jgi:arylsulfatase A-like enzyme
VPPVGASKSNVLFLVIDDFRPELSVAYGQHRLVTPNLDKFARSALTFGHAYVQFAHYSPSRNSFLSGRSPQTTQVWQWGVQTQAGWFSGPSHRGWVWGEDPASRAGSQEPAVQAGSAGEN